ncbi:MAG: hypothetical protein M3348_17585 [Acidobacteriota bacterium]|nr:hypothetical protein [Acidobacteriota bacterium]
MNALIEAGRLPAEKFGVNHMIDARDLRLVKDRKAGRPKKKGSTRGANRA